MHLAQAHTMPSGWQVRRKGRSLGHETRDIGKLLEDRAESHGKSEPYRFVVLDVLTYPVL